MDEDIEEFDTIFYTYCKTFVFLLKKFVLLKKVQVFHTSVLVPSKYQYLVYFWCSNLYSQGFLAAYNKI